jgi:hypothetical protein
MDFPWDMQADCYVRLTALLGPERRKNPSLGGRIEVLPILPPIMRDPAAPHASHHHSTAARRLNETYRRLFPR